MISLTSVTRVYVASPVNINTNIIDIEIATDNIININRVSTVITGKPKLKTKMILIGIIAVLTCPTMHAPIYCGGQCVNILL